METTLPAIQVGPGANNFHEKHGKVSTSREEAITTTLMPNGLS
jgi:hypothetical protein